MFLFFLVFQVNLRYGVLNPLSRTGTESDTCTACAGTMILEFAALSRLSGDSIFEVFYSYASLEIRLCSFSSLFLCNKALLGNDCAMSAVVLLEMIFGHNGFL